MEQISHFSATLQIVLGIFSVVTICWIVLLVYRTLIGKNEETDLIIDKAEARIAKEQHDLGERVEKFDKPIKILGISVGVLAVLSIALWLWEGFNRSNQ
jgi:hypothetical protein